MVPASFAGFGSKIFSTDSDPDLNLAHLKSVKTKFKPTKLNKTGKTLAVKCITLFSNSSFMRFNCK